MKIALLTDIHANLEALESVLEDVKKHGIEDIFSLGDNVGYGPDPVAVLKCLYQHDVYSLEGNHDFAVVNPKSFSDATHLAIEALEWTRLQLCQESSENPEFQHILSNYLGTESSCSFQDDPRITLVHGTPGPDEMRFEYILEPEDLIQPSRYMKKKGLRICFFGHTHHQILWEVDLEGVSVIDFEPNETIVYTDEEIDCSWLVVNPGSVGQPRDQNPHAAYLIYEQSNGKHSFTFQRIPYNIEKTINKIYTIAELDNRLGDRLTIGA